MDVVTEERLDVTFAALSNSTRRAILGRLAEGQANVTQLAEPFQLSLPAISKHLKVLERAGLIVRGQQAQFRPCSLDAAPLKEVSSWTEHYRPVWESRFDRMDTHLQQLQAHRRTAMTMSDDNSDQHLILVRTMQAPPDQVWKMWTQPEHFAAWYGPAGVSIPAVTMDVRVGGMRHVCMEMTTPHGKARMWFAGEYLEVVENERLVYTEAMSDEDGTMSSPKQAAMAGHPTTTRVHVELEAVNGGTRMTLTHIGIPGDSPAASGWAMAFDKLTARLDEQRATTRDQNRV